MKQQKSTEVTNLNKSQKQPGRSNIPKGYHHLASEFEPSSHRSSPAS
jgi:hypothetical protein